MRRAANAAAVIDPVLDFDAKPRAYLDRFWRSAWSISARERGLDVRWLLETHAHADHLSAAHWLKSNHWPDARSPSAAASAWCRRRSARCSTSASISRSTVRNSTAPRTATDSKSVPAARVIVVPGHTSDSNAYLIGDALFTGDSLFMPDGGSARCDFPGGDAATLYRSIRRLFELPDATRVFVCHDYGPAGARSPAKPPSANRSAPTSTCATAFEAEFVAMREARDATLAMPALILPAVQVNIRAGALPDAEDNGVRYLKLPVDRL